MALWNEVVLALPAYKERDTDFRISAHWQNGADFSYVVEYSGWLMGDDLSKDFDCYEKAKEYLIQLVCGAIRVWLPKSELPDARRAEILASLLDGAFI